MSRDTKEMEIKLWMEQGEIVVAVDGGLAAVLKTDHLDKYMDKLLDVIRREINKWRERYEKED